MKFSALPNLRSVDVVEVDPSTIKHTGYPDGDKKSFRAWCANKETNHCFYTAAEAVIPSLRVTKENSAVKLHGIILDYDSEIDDEIEKTISKISPADLTPTWISTTRSGGRRLVFEFESPMPVENKQLYEQFIRRLAKEVRARDLLPGLDAKSFDLTQHFELGKHWRKLPGGKPISKDRLGLILFEAAKEKVIAADGPSIPIEAVAEEVEKRWPGRIPGQFEVGVRIPLFWIDPFVDRIGAMIGDFGVIAYSDRAGRSFVPWAEILGHEFVRAFQASRIGAAADGLWYDGKQYWFKDEEGCWRHRNKDDTIMRLKGMGVSARRPPKEEASEAERVLLEAQRIREVKAAAPIVHDNRECVIINGEKYLNISAVKVLQPADHYQLDDFPWLNEFFLKIWDSAHPEQRDYYLAWLQHFYRSCLRGEPQQGQAIIISGLPSTGKTFHNYHILGKLMGGFSDPSDFLMGRTNFNKADSEVAVWAIDDTRGASTWANHSIFSAALKKHVANPMVRCEGKNANAFQIPWKGRIVVTCNTDKESLNIIPYTHTSIMDKMMLFKWGNWRANFLPNGGTEKVVAKELPYFAAWLRDYKPPAYVLDDNPRYFVKSYHHPEMLKESNDASPHARLAELIADWKESSGVKADKEKKRIWATPTKLRRLLSETNNTARDALREFNRERLAAALESLRLKERENGNSTEYLIYDREAIKSDKG